MKLIYICMAACLVLQVGCTPKPQEQKEGQSFLMDSLYQNNKQVTTIQKGDKVLLSEEMKNFEDNPNISQADLDAIKHLEMKNVKYVEKGDKIILSEKE